MISCLCSLSLSLSLSLLFFCSFHNIVYHRGPRLSQDFLGIFAYDCDFIFTQSLMKSMFNSVLEQSVCMYNIKHFHNACKINNQDFGGPSKKELLNVTTETISQLISYINRRTLADWQRYATKIESHCGIFIAVKRKLNFLKF